MWSVVYVYSKINSDMQNKIVLIILPNPLIKIVSHSVKLNKYDENVYTQT